MRTYGIHTYIMHHTSQVHVVTSYLLYTTSLMPAALAARASRAPRTSSTGSATAASLDNAWQYTYAEHRITHAPLAHIHVASCGAGAVMQRELHSWLLIKRHHTVLVAAPCH